MVSDMSINNKLISKLKLFNKKMSKYKKKIYKLIEKI